MREIFPATHETVPNHSAAPGYPQAPASAFTLRDILLLLRRRRWLILTGTLLGTLASVALALGSPRQYTASTSIIVETQQASPITGPNAPVSARADEAFVLNQLGIIRSRQHAKLIVEDLGLFKGQSEEGDRTLISAAGRHLGDALDRVLGWVPQNWLSSAGLADTPQPPKMLDSEPSEDVRDVGPPRDAMSARVDAFGKRYSASRTDNSNVITITFTDEDPEVAAKVVNRAAEIYIEQQIQDKLDDTQKILGWMGDRLGAMEGEVRQSEAAVEAYRARKGLIGSQQARSEQEEAAELNRQLGEVRAESLDLQSRLQLARRLRSGGDTDGLLTILSSPLLASLREQELALARQEAELASSYGARHPRMLLLKQEKERIGKELDREVGRLASDLERQVGLTRERVRQIESQIASLKARDYTRGEAEVGMRELDRKAQAGRDMYQVLLQRFKQISEQEKLVEPDARIISRASPPTRPSSLSPRLFGLIGLTGSFAGSVLLALLIDGLDRRVRSTQQVERLFGLKVLGVGPQLGVGRSDRGAYRYLLSKPMSAYAEALRSVFNSVRLSNGGADRPPKVVLISSALSGEGKTSFSMSLAVIAAQWGQRVLVVDLDLRHPCIARAAGGQSPAVGLAEVLTGLCPPGEAIRRSDGGFDYIGVRAPPDNPASLVGSPQLGRLLEELRASYDLVILDAPPVLAVADGHILAPLADKVVFVVQWRRTPLSAIRHALDILRDARADLAGVVMLRVNIQKYLYFENDDGINYYSSLKKYYYN